MREHATSPTPESSFAASSALTRSRDEPGLTLPLRLDRCISSFWARIRIDHHHICAQRRNDMGLARDTLEYSSYILNQIALNSAQSKFCCAVGYGHCESQPRNSFYPHNFPAHGITRARKFHRSSAEASRFLQPQVVSESDTVSQCAGSRLLARPATQGRLPARHQKETHPW